MAQPVLVAPASDPGSPADRRPSPARPARREEEQDRKPQQRAGDDADQHERVAEALAGATINPPAVPVWSNVDAKPHTDPAEIRGLLVRQVLSPVRWEDTVRGLLADGVERFYEIGPGRVLAGLMKRVNRKADVRNVAA